MKQTSLPKLGKGYQSTHELAARPSAGRYPGKVSGCPAWSRVGRPGPEMPAPAGRENSHKLLHYRKKPPCPVSPLRHRAGHDRGLQADPGGGGMRVARACWEIYSSLQPQDATSVFTQKPSHIFPKSVSALGFFFYWQTRMAPCKFEGNAFGNLFLLRTCWTMGSLYLCLHAGCSSSLRPGHGSHAPEIGL